MPPVQLLFGPMLVGVFMNAVLYGVMLVQTVIYYQTYKKDSTRMKLFVLFLFIAETLNTGFDLALIYEPLVQKYGTPPATTFFPLFLPTDPLLTVIISTPIQIFIAYRIKIISRASWLAAAICALAIASFGGGIWLTVTIIHIRRFARKPELHWPALLWLLASAIADVTITVSLTWNLAKRKTGFSGTDDAINRIIRLTIQTGFITAVFAILDVACFLALPHTTINFVWDFALSKLYTNALLSTLNARSSWGTLSGAGGAAGHHNVLFGSSNAPQSAQTYSATNFRGTRQIMTAATGTGTGTYELDSAYKSRLPDRDDPEFGVGISVTKEVDTVVDPAPLAGGYHSQWQ